MKSKQTVDATREKEVACEVSRLTTELELSHANQQRMEVEMRVSRLNANELRKESRMKDKELLDLTSTVAEE